ncbi:unnamed protein product [Cuscuta campestris]|uniref:Uncharacterized protein n=1 Tax=Cuscuta campestris TaxID=132261 RepID=A0A484LSX7_9ASTE|nr:unnamed protein product [Cuscuta campestris]
MRKTTFSKVSFYAAPKKKPSFFADANKLRIAVISDLSFCAKKAHDCHSFGSFFDAKKHKIDLSFYADEAISESKKTQHRNCCCSLELRQSGKYLVNMQKKERRQREEVPKRMTDCARRVHDQL